MSSAPPTVLAFGDESENEQILVYALAIFCQERADDARVALASIKRSLGVPEDTPLHCRIAFSGQRRRGTAWADVNPARLQGAVRALVVELRQIGETPEICVLERRRVPPLPVAPGHPDREWRTKETLAFAANIAFMGAATRYGLDRVRFVIDADRTRIQRGLRHQRADTTRGLFVDVGPGREPMRIDPEVQEGTAKDPLLEVADLYAHTALRAQSREPGRWFVELFEVMQPNIGRMDLSAREPWTDARNQPVE